MPSVSAEVKLFHYSERLHKVQNNNKNGKIMNIHSTCRRLIHSTPKSPSALPVLGREAVKAECVLP